MPPSLEQLQAFLKVRPDDPFLKYAIAIELKNSGSPDKAQEFFALLAQQHPSYVPTYYHWGQTLELLGRQDEALSAYETGITVAQAAGDAHAAEELQRALALLRDLM